VRSLPSGAVTFLFTDVEGSTRLVKLLRERYAEVLAVHQALLRDAFRSHGGHEVDTQGDSFFVAFGNARDALLAALDSQRALAAQSWPDGTELRVRMGIHTGQAVPSGSSYTGLAVHRAARISAAGHGGQILVSQATEALVEDDAEHLGVRLRDLGEQRLKDLDRPVRLYQLEAPGLPQQFPPLRTLDVDVRARRRRRTILIAVVVIAVAGALAGTLLATRSGGGKALTATPNSVAIIDMASNRVVQISPVGQTPTSVVYGESAVWVLNSDEQTVSQLDPRTGTRVRTQPAPAGATDLAIGAGALWVATNRRTVTRFDPLSGFKTQTFSLPVASAAAGPQATQLAADSGSVWAGGPGVVVRLAPRPQRQVEDAFCCGELAIGAGAVWATDLQGVLQIDPGKGTRAGHVTLSFLGRDVAADDGAVWVTNQGGDQVWRIDPKSAGIVDAIKVGTNPSGVAIGEGAVWVASGVGTVARIDPKTDKVVATIQVGGTPNGLAIGNGRVWVSVD
jgi:YVTN family beta-propeller protein